MPRPRAAEEGGAVVSGTRGSATLELSFLVEDERLTEIGVEGYTRSKTAFANVGGCALTKTERDAIWCALPEWLQEKLLDEAAENAEPVGDDDWSADDARMPRAG